MFLKILNEKMIVRRILNEYEEDFKRLYGGKTNIILSEQRTANTSALLF